MDTKDKLPMGEMLPLALLPPEKMPFIKEKLQKHNVSIDVQELKSLETNEVYAFQIYIHKKDLNKAFHLWDELCNYALQKSNSGLDLLDPIGAAPYVLIPIDFETHNDKIVDFAFYFARRRNLEVVLLYAFDHNKNSDKQILAQDKKTSYGVQGKNFHKDFEDCSEKLDKIVENIQERIQEGSLPDVPMKAYLQNGNPNKVILEMSQKRPPVTIVMGVKEKKDAHEDIVDSVTDKIIDNAKVPVFIIPPSIQVNKFQEMKHVAIGTSFDHRDFLLFDDMLKLVHPHIPSYTLFNIEQSKKELTDLELKAMFEYYKEYYPEEKISFAKLKEHSLEAALQIFIDEKDIDLFVINNYNRNLFARMFSNSIAHRMLCYTEKPLLVMHNQK